MTNLRQSADFKALNDKLLSMVEDVLNHDGFGDIHIEVRILKRQQKEVIIHYGKQHRFVIDSPQESGKQQS